MQENVEDTPGILGSIQKVLDVRHEELQAVAWSFLYFFCIMFAYFTLRPVREALVITAGVENIPKLFTATFFAMLVVTPIFGWVASRFPRRVFLPWVYYFFVSNILIFYVVFSYMLRNELDMVVAGVAFFVWISVFNLFVVSVFWSFMADIYSKEQGRRLFGAISAGGSAGALIGPAATGLLVIPLGFQNLLLISASLLMLAVFCVYRLRHWVKEHETDPEQTPGDSVESAQAVGGSALSGVLAVFKSPYFAIIVLTLACANFLGGAAYRITLTEVGNAFATQDERTQVFALFDLLINCSAFVLQLLVVKISVEKLGVGRTLVALPLLSMVGFATLAANPVIIIVATLWISRRAITFGFSKPTNDMLYSVVNPEEKYKAKNFIETTVYRGWDVVAGWCVDRILAVTAGFTVLSLICIPVAAIWIPLSLWLGREYERRDKAQATLAPD